MGKMARNEGNAGKNRNEKEGQWGERKEDGWWPGKKEERGEGARSLFFFYSGKQKFRPIRLQLVDQFAQIAAVMVECILRAVWLDNIGHVT